MSTKKTYEFTPSEAAFLANTCIASSRSTVAGAVESGVGGFTPFYFYVEGPTSIEQKAREVAKPVGVHTIQKAIEENVVTATKARRIKGSGRITRNVPDAAVLYAAAYRLLDVPLAKEKKSDLYKWLRYARNALAHGKRPDDWKLSGTLNLRLEADNTIKTWVELIDAYGGARDRYIRTDPEIMGGTPVINGSRMTVYSVLGRIQGGDTFEDLVREYPEIPGGAFEAAYVYAKTNPRHGRPPKFRD